jgi:hypothetical protein
MRKISALTIIACLWILVGCGASQVDLSGDPWELVILDDPMQTISWFVFERGDGITLGLSDWKVYIGQKNGGGPQSTSAEYEGDLLMFMFYGGWDNFPMTTFNGRSTSRFKFEGILDGGIYYDEPAELRR